METKLLLADLAVAQGLVADVKHYGESLSTVTEQTQKMSEAMQNFGAEVTSVAQIAALKKLASTARGRAAILAEVQAREAGATQTDLPRSQRRKQERQQLKQARRLNTILDAARAAGAKVERK